MPAPRISPRLAPLGAALACALFLSHGARAQSETPGSVDSAQAPAPAEAS